MKKYQVIGGQYEEKWYGESDSLRGARIVAGRHQEYWDNWQGWNTPKIYSANDVTEIESMGRLLTRDGEVIRVTQPWAEPIPDCVKDKPKTKE